MMTEVADWFRRWFMWMDLAVGVAFIPALVISFMFVFNLIKVTKHGKSIRPTKSMVHLASPPAPGKKKLRKTRTSQTKVSPGGASKTSSPKLDLVLEEDEIKFPAKQESEKKDKGKSAESVDSPKSPKLPETESTPVSDEFKKDYKRHKTWDQFVFTCSVLNLGITTWMMGAFPGYFHYWHSVNCVFLLTVRWYVFRKDNQHYFLYDFCYWANIYSLVYVFYSNQNPEIFQVLFMVSNGPLAWSIPAFSSSVVFHNIQHMTSVWIHFSPMALTFCLRWYVVPGFEVCKGGLDHCNDIDANDLILSAINRFYIWWVVLYYVWVFVVLDKRVKSRGYMTLFTWIYNFQVMKDIFNNISENHLVQKAIYVLGHYTFGIFTMAFAVLVWRNFWLHLIFIIFIGAISAWNGAGHYINVFPKIYEEKLNQNISKKLADKRSRSAGVENRADDSIRESIRRYSFLRRRKVPELPAKVSKAVDGMRLHNRSLSM